jgi:hypothetical protein
LKSPDFWGCFGLGGRYFPNFAYAVGDESAMIGVVNSQILTASCILCVSFIEAAGAVCYILITPFHQKTRVLPRNDFLPSPLAGLLFGVSGFWRALEQK